ncbi:MAG TPA: pyruvate formate lyase family protein [Candidatus Latescibacteria bacterium]|nr:pyruvate formate lyase family protein [Candidatus Latescibacterota bacterium]
MKQTAVSEVLERLGEPFAAGFMRDPDATMVERFANALNTWARVLPLRPYDGGLLYPSGPKYWNPEGMAVGWYYVTATPLDRGVFEKKLAASNPEEREALAELERVWSAHVFPGGYTHSIPHYERVLREGLNGFDERVRKGLQTALSERDSRAGFFRAMETTLDTARILHRRIVEEIERFVPGDDEQRGNRDALLAALRVVPFRPAERFFDALVATNFTFYFDGCDDLGRFDQYLRPYFERSLAEGELSHDRAVELVRAQWENVNAATAWNAAIGGTKPDGTDLSSELTIVCIEAARGMRRPNLALRLGPSTPDSVWEAALDTIVSGCGLPALYWDPNYYRAMDASGIPLPVKERHEYAFGGCTELMVQGRSNVGSLDDDINVPGVLERSLHGRLPTAADFPEFREGFRNDLAATIASIVERVNLWQQQKAEWQPQPIRSLLIDDCVDRGIEYSAGGARYNWSVINVMGLANAIDSLAALRTLVFEERRFTGREIVDVLARDFDGAEELRRELENAPRYGNGDPEVDSLAHDLSQFIFTEFLKYRTWRRGADGEGGPFVPSCLMFVTYVPFGRAVGATPDGRRAKEPIADSAGPYQGRDRSGPTAMMRSVTQLDQQHAPGTLVVNLRLARHHFATPEQRANTKALLRTYFDMGGLQIQVNVVDQKVLRDAVAHPEKYGDLIVRVGGYSEYWSNLEPALRESVLLRTEH